MPEVLHAFEIIDGRKSEAKTGTLAIFGNDWFLRHQALRCWLETTGLGGEAVRFRSGEEASWRDVHDDLASRSLFEEAGCRLTVLRQADGFLSKHRSALERWVDSPAAGATLILELESLPANTRLYKLILEKGLLIAASAPLRKGSKDAIDERVLQQWLIGWARTQHRLQLTSKQAMVLIERIGAVFGLLDSELAKLALFTTASGLVEDTMVHELVGGWRTKTVWEIADGIAEGNASLALGQLDQLFASGQTAFGVLAQLSWYFRRFGLAAHLIEQAERTAGTISIASALEQAGFQRYLLADAEKKLRRIGRQRARQLLEWLKHLDLKLKGSHSHEDRARLAIEEFVMRLA
jgi:DNA polymerase-3 subunit delta